ncbi:SDR family NAD(P)-dependent oxidoreductase [Variovorax sp. HJSM1_2]|uniref:SDR family NAD(P)-dependent oxidoreductase n=1 Tax=Variovorax sp. HJSM1_2 TaxID=3366263 RepID=UPI003BEDD2C9
MTQANLYILTGGSRGMGLAIAEQLLQPGNTVITISRRTNTLLEAHATSARATLEQWSHDLTTSIPVGQHLAHWLQHQGHSDFASATLINNAGTLAQLVPLSQADPLDLAHALRVGLEAPMQLTAAFLRATAEWKGVRRVLNISSGLGRRAMASQAAYCAAKAGLDHFTRCLALDESLKPNGAKVCSLAPGVIDTDMQVALRGADAKHFPDQANFASLKSGDKLSSPADAAKQVLAYLERADFGSNPVADVRD